MGIMKTAQQAALFIGPSLREARLSSLQSKTRRPPGRQLTRSSLFVFRKRMTLHEIRFTHIEAMRERRWRPFSASC